MTIENIITEADRSSDATTSKRDPVVQYQIKLAHKYLNLLQSAKRRDKEFKLTLSDMDQLLKRKTCFYTGVKLTDDIIVGESPVLTHRTIDRIDSNLGYIRSNVVACSHFANQIKNKLYEDPRDIMYGKTKDILKIITKMEDILK